MCSFGAGKMHPAAWAVMSLLWLSSHEVTVRDSDLKLCEDNERVCVTDLRDCGPRPPSSVQKTLNVSCYYEVSHRSMTCDWSPAESPGHREADVSLIFSSEHDVVSCEGIFNPAAVLNLTVRIRSYLLGRDTWSQPHTVFLYDAVKPPRPALVVLGSTEDSVVVSWRSSGDGSCRLCYRDHSTRTWTQAPDSVPAHQHQTLTYTIKDLVPFTVYRAAVSCREESGIWSDWSPDVSARTLDTVPSRPPEVCYRVENTSSGGSVLLHLMWKDLDLRDAGGRILGYQVSYKPARRQQLQDGFALNVTEVTALLVVEEGNCSVTVAAFNTAGHGPAAHLSIDTLRQKPLPSVRNLWVSSSFPAVKGLLVQWKSPPPVPPSVPPVTHVAVQWRPETRPSTSRWTTVDGFITSTFIQDVDPDESYLVTVFPVYSQRCGRPQSLAASLQQGALMEAVQLQVVGVTKTTVKVAWAWQKKSGPIRVDRYAAVLKKDSDRQTLSLWPDQRQHTLSSLKPDTEYRLLLMADNVSTNIVPVRTHFDEVPAVAAATPLLLLAAALFIVCVLVRTVYKSYFFPPISSPRSSTAGQWLMDPNHQRSAERTILDIQDFQVTDVLGEKSLITVGPSSEEDLQEDASLLSLLIITLSSPELDTGYVCNAAPSTEQASRHPDYVNCRHPDAVSTCERREEPEADSCFPQRAKQSRRVDSSREETAVKSRFGAFMAPADRQMTWEDEYVLSSCFLWKTDAQTVSGQTASSPLICDTDYISNSFGADGQ